MQMVYSEFEMTFKFVFPGTGERKGSTNVGAIVGGVIGGIVFVVIIVAVAVYCSRRESKGKSSCK